MNDAGPPIVDRRHRGRLRRSSCICTLVVALLVASAGCRTRYARRPEVGKVAFYEVGGQIELSARRNRGNEDSKVGQANYRTRDDVFREKLGLDTRGYAYHPNLLEFSLAGLFGLVQRNFDSNFESTNPEGREDNGTTFEFDVSGVILKEKAYPTRLFARRAESLEPQAFRPSVERESTRYGLEWRYVDLTTPTRILLERSDVDFDQLGSTDADWGQKQDLLRIETAYNFAADNQLQLTFEHREVDESRQALRGSFDYDIDEARLDHTMRFGGKPASNLRSNLTYYEQSGENGIERFDWTEFLELKHGEDFDTWYHAELGDRTQEDSSGGRDQEERTYVLGTGLQHRLYESLISTASVELEDKDFEGGPELEIQRFNAGLSYRKKNAAGRLTSAVSVQAQTTDNSGSERPFFIVDERQTFIDPNPIILTAPNIITPSILITNTQATFTYMLGLDYTVVVFANQVEINRLVTGRITNGQTVLIDYQLAPSGSYQLDTTRVQYRLRQDFRFGLAPYYRLEWQGENLSGDEQTAPIPDDLTAHIFGLDYRRDTIDAHVEYEDHDSQIAPYTSVEAGLGFSHRFRFPATARLHALWSNIDYEEPRRETTIADVTGTYRHVLADNLNVEARAMYRYEDDTIRNISKGYDFYLTVEWIYRDFRFRLNFESSRFSTDTNRTRNSMLYLQILRTF